MINPSAQPNPTQKRAVVVLNAAAGMLSDRDVTATEAAIRTPFQNAGYACTIRTCSGEEVVARCQEAAAEKVDLLLIGGGDGSVMAAAKALLGTDTALGILPLGTLNLLARDLGIPLELEAAATALSRARVQAIDVASVNDEKFLCYSIMGVFPSLAEHRETARAASGPFRWIQLANNIGFDLLNSEPVRYRLNLGNRRRRYFTQALIVANNEISPAPGFFLRRAALDRGTLAVYITRQRTFFGLLGLMWRALWGRFTNTPRLRKLLAQSVEVIPEDARVPISLDGEVTELEPPLRFSIKPKALQVLVPQPDYNTRIER